MKICFDMDNLSFRGTTTAILDYAFFNEKILGNESIISFHTNVKKRCDDENYLRKDEILNLIQSNYKTIEYTSNEDLEKKLFEIDCNYIYYLKAGFFDDRIIKNIKNLIHVVFNFYDPHGQKYIYISDWLSNTASNGRCKSVPHIVDLPKIQNENIRQNLNIPNDSIVIGRYGGYNQFDINFVYDTINYIVNCDPKFVFLFVNTRKFIDHPNVIFLDSVIGKQEKTDFILACDAMLHARSDGESFGLSICEFLFHNKPVISFGGGRDKNNVELLKNYDLIFNNQYELLDKLFKLKYNFYKEDYSKIVNQFNPVNVMEIFNNVFLGE